jgi:hypothetical protein
MLEAAERGDVEVVRAFTKAGATVNGRSPDGETPRVDGACSGNPAAVEVLLQAGADVKAKDNYGEGALKYGALGLERQADLAKHPAPLEDLLRDYLNKSREIRAILIAAGAKEEKPPAK